MLILSMLGNCPCFSALLSAVLMNFKKHARTHARTHTHTRNIIRVSNSLDPDQDRRSVGPDLAPNCLQMLSADDLKNTVLVFMLFFLHERESFSHEREVLSYRSRSLLSRT